MSQFYILRSKLFVLCKFKGDRSGNEEIRWKAVISLSRDDLAKTFVVAVNLEENDGFEICSGVSIHRACL